MNDNVTVDVDVVDASVVWSYCWSFVCADVDADDYLIDD